MCYFPWLRQVNVGKLGCGVSPEGLISSVGVLAWLGGVWGGAALLMSISLITSMPTSTESKSKYKGSAGRAEGVCPLPCDLPLELLYTGLARRCVYSKPKRHRRCLFPVVFLSVFILPALKFFI